MGCPEGRKQYFNGHIAENGKHMPVFVTPGVEHWLEMIIMVLPIQDSSGVDMFMREKT